MVIPDEMDFLRQLFDLSQSPPSTNSNKNQKPGFVCDFDDVFGAPYSSMAGKYGNYWGEDLMMIDPFLPRADEFWDCFPNLGEEALGDQNGLQFEPDHRSDAFTAEEFADGVQNWEDSLGQNGELPEYLLAGSTRSPIPMDYSQLNEEIPSKDTIKQEPYSPTRGDSFSLENRTGPFSSSLGQHFQTLDDAKVKTRTTQKRTPVVKKPSFALPKPRRQSPTRALVERQKRQSDDDNESVSSFVSETPTDGTDVSAASVSSAGLPSLPRISTVAFSEQQIKRQRRDVSMSAPAVAARELRQKKKIREEQLISECLTLQAEAEIMEKATTDAQSQLEKLREDSLYLRSLVKSQHTTVSLLEYLQKAPFFRDGGQQMHLDSRSMLRQISGTDLVRQADGMGEEKNEVGGICLHINGSNITLHLCSHCSSEASAK